MGRCEGASTTERRARTTPLNPDKEYATTSRESITKAAKNFGVFTLGANEHAFFNNPYL